MRRPPLDRFHSSVAVEDDDGAAVRIVRRVADAAERADVVRRADDEQRPALVQALLDHELVCAGREGQGARVEQGTPHKDSAARRS